MALGSTGFMAAPGLYGTTGQLDKLDVSDVLAAILLRDTATLGQIPMKGTVHNIEHFFFEDELNTCVLSGIQSCSASGDFTYLSICNGFTSAKIARLFRVGAIFRQEGYPTHVFRAGNYGSTHISLYYHGSITVAESVIVSAATCTATRWFIVANPKADTSDYSDDISQARTRRKNYTQVFERGIQIAETREHIDLYGVPDELKHQIKLRTMEIKRELNNSVLNGFAYSDGTAYTPDIETRTMAGIIQLIMDPGLDGTAEGTTVTNAANGALTMTRINDHCKKMWDQGGFGDDSNVCIITSAYQARIIALLEEQRIRRSSKELVVGTYANKVMTDLGFELPVVIDRWCPSEMMIFLDKNAVKLMPLKGDSWHMEKMAKSGRTQGYQLSGQYTIELRNADARHGLISNLSFS